jgi:hypothetical protein
MAIPRSGLGRSPRLATKVATTVGQFAILVAFAAAGTIFLGLLIASPIGVPVAERQGIAVSAADLAVANHLGSLWWLFAAGTVLSCIGALATLGNLMRRLGATQAE